VIGDKLPKNLFVFGLESIFDTQKEGLRFLKLHIFIVKNDTNKWDQTLNCDLNN